MTIRPFVRPYGHPQIPSPDCHVYVACACGPAEAAEAMQEARRAYMAASDHLAGAMCVARGQGMSVSEIARVATVRRDIVYKRTEA